MDDQYLPSAESSDLDFSHLSGEQQAQEKWLLIQKYAPAL